jgi:hypothetical protein
MTSNHSPGAAVTDAELIRYLDGELDDDERGRIDEALAGDPGLARRFAQLRTRAERLSALLGATDAAPAVAAAPPAASAPGAAAPPAAPAKVIDLNAAWAAQQGVPPHPVRPYRPLAGWLRAAAVVAFLLAGTLLVPPVRAWIAGVLARAFDKGDEATAIGSRPVASPPVDTLSITFATGSATFTLEFAAAPTAGRLVVERTRIDSVFAALYTTGGGEELQRVRSDLLRVANAAASTADYRLVLPSVVSTVVVRVPGRADAVWRFDTGGPQRQVIELRD